MGTTIVEGKRYDLSKLYSVPNARRRQIATGVSREAIYVTKSGRVIVETYSVWEDRNTHGVKGTQYHFADAAEIALLAADTDDEELLHLVPVAEDA